MGSRRLLVCLAHHSIWLLLAAVSMALSAACGNPESGAPEPEEEVYEPLTDAARWGAVRGTETAAGLSGEQEGAIARIEALGYVDGIEPPPDAEGVTVYSPEHVREGLNFFVSSHDTYAALMDMEGNVLHEWSCPFERALPDFPTEHDFEGNRFHWRRAFLRPEGQLIAIHEGMGMVCLDRDSKVLWARPNKAHHDMDFHGDGRIFALTRQGEFHPRFDAGEPVLLDYVSILTPEGETIRSISIDQAYLDSEFEPPDKVMHWTRNIYHTNTIEILNGRLAERIPAFAAGNLLLSLRNINELAVLDPETEKLVWIAEGPWIAQHQPEVLENGNLLVFDNKGGDPLGGRARVLELDPVSLEIVWKYEGTPEHPLDCDFLGTSYRLTNGNTLAVESVHGRVIEITPEGQIAWEYINPRRAGENDEYIAVIPDMIRIDTAEVAGWLELPGRSQLPDEISEM